MGPIVQLGLTLSLSAAAPFPALSPEETSILLDLRSMRPVVEVFVNNEGPFKFVLDTGSSQTMVSWDLASRLSLPREGTVMVGAPNSEGQVRAPVHRMKEMRVGDLKFFGVKAVALPDDGFVRQLRADGILSAQDFRGYLVRLDYRKRLLTVSPGRLPLPDERQVLEYSLRASVPGIELVVDGKPTFFHLDTGSPFYIALPGSMLTTANYERAPSLAGTASTIVGTFNVYSAQLGGNVTFGQYSIEKPQVEVLDKMPYGNLGYRFFRDYRITFDYAAQRVRLEHWKDAEAAGVPPKWASGASR